MATTLIQQQQQQQQQLQQQQPEHNIELMCRICAVDFKIAAEGIPIFSTDQLMDKIKNYLHIQVNAMDKLSHLICNECVRKIENFHCYALMAQKNQELFNIMYSEKIYREHCTALSSLNTTLYREPPTVPQVQQVQPKLQASPPIQSPKQKHKSQQPQQQQPQQKQIPLQPLVSTHQLQQQQEQQQQQLQNQQQQQQQQQHPVAVLSTEDITIFTYQDLKLGQVIKDQELLKLILRALKWNDVGRTIEFQLDRLKNTSFRAVLSSPDLLRDEDLVQLLGPYLDHGSFAPLDHTKPTGADYNAKLMDQNTVTEMEVGVDPELFLPYDDDETKSMDQVEIAKVTKMKKERKKYEPRSRVSSKKTSSSSAVVASNATTGKIRVKPETQLLKSKSTKQQVVNVPVPVPPPQPSILPKQQPIQNQQKIAEEVPLVMQSIPEMMPKELQITQQIQPSSPPAVKVQQSPPQPSQQLPTKTASQQPNQAHTQSAVNIPSKSTVAAKISKPEPPKPRQQRKIKNDQLGPKTRARSIFNAKHKCGVCNKKLSTSGNLKAHLKTHKPKGKFNCDKCGRIFKTQVNLQRHKEYHAGERYSCRTCGRVYPSNSTLKQHEIAHSNFRPHKCNICQKTFKRNQDLKFHTNQHTGEKPYKCPYCPRAFASSGNCFSHRKRVHSDKTLTTSTAAATTTTSNNKKMNAVENSYSRKYIKA